METFNEVLPSVVDDYRVIGMDSRGHGKSTLGSEPLTYERLEKDVEAVLTHLGINTLSVVGFSDGGIVAYRLASSGAFKVERLLTIGAEWSTEHAKAKFPLYAKITGDTWKKKFPGDFEVYQKLNPKPDFDGFCSQLIQMWSDVAESGYPNERVHTITCPVLAIRGEEDFLVSRDSVAALAEKVENVQSLEVASAGHEAHREQPAVFLKAFKDFF